MEIMRKNEIVEKLLGKKLNFSHGVENSDFNQIFFFNVTLYCIKDEIE